MRRARGTHGLDDRRIDALTLLGEFSDLSQCLGVGGDQFVAADAVCPFLERCCALGPCYAVVAQAVRSTGTEVAAKCFADDVRRRGVLRGSAFVHCSSQLGVESDG